MLRVLHVKVVATICNASSATIMSIIVFEAGQGLEGHANKELSIIIDNRYK